MKTIYLAGPMRNYPRFNADAFDAAKKWYQTRTSLSDEAMYNVISPVDLDREDGVDHDTMTEAEAEEYAKEAIKKCRAVIRNEADEVHMLPGWYNSRGALEEAIEARKYDVPVVEAYTMEPIEMPQDELESKLMMLERCHNAAKAMKALFEDTSKPENRDFVGHPAWTHFNGNTWVYSGGFTDRETQIILEAIEEHKVEISSHGQPDIHEFDTGSVRSSDCDEVAYHLISPVGLRRLAETCREGSVKYGDYNWEKGQPAEEILNHCIKHVYQYLSGDRSEDHLAHSAWNLFAVMHMEEVKPEMLSNLRTGNMVPPEEQS